MPKKRAKKTAPRRRASKKAAKRPTNPSPVKTGTGASPAEIGKDLVSMFNQGLYHGGQIEDKWWSPKIVSVEGVGVSLAWSGRKAVEGKNNGWMADHAIHGASAEGPFVGASGFAVRFKMDVETKSTGQRQTMHEIGVYTVQNGKIVREEFMYGM